VTTTKSQRILVVDDYEDMRFALVAMFEAEGFDVVGEAANGSEAVWRAGEEQPDVIILDFRMPGLSAEQTANVLRHVAPESSIVVFSGYLDEEPTWADAYMSKDQITELPDLVRSLRDKRADT
jgi:YesN/AraC family two-component response regulator